MGYGETQTTGNAVLAGNDFCQRAVVATARDRKKRCRILKRADSVQPRPYRLIQRLRQVEVDHQDSAPEHDQTSGPPIVAGITVLERIDATNAQSAVAISPDTETLNGDGIVKQQQAF